MSQNTLPKEPLSVQIQNFWHSLPPAVQTSTPFILAALLTFVEQLISGRDLKEAALIFVGALLGIVKTFQAVSLTADKHEEEALNQDMSLEDGTFSAADTGIAPASEIPSDDQSS